MRRLLSLLAEHPADSLRILFCLLLLYAAIRRGEAVLRPILQSIRLRAKEKGRPSGSARAWTVQKQARNGKPPSAAGKAAAQALHSSRTGRSGSRAQPIKRAVPAGDQRGSGSWQLRARQLCGGLAHLGVICSVTILLLGAAGQTWHMIRGRTLAGEEPGLFLLLQEGALLVMVIGAVTAGIRMSRQHLQGFKARRGDRVRLAFLAVWLLSILLSLSAGRLTIEEERVPSLASAAFVPTSHMPASRSVLLNTAVSDSVQAGEGSTGAISIVLQAGSPPPTAGQIAALRSFSVLPLWHTILAVQEHWKAEALRLQLAQAVTERSMTVEGGWAADSLTGLLAKAIAPRLPHQAAASAGSELLWWVQHAALLGCLATGRRGMLTSRVAGLLLLWLSRTKKRGVLPPLPIEDEQEQPLGVQAIEHFSRRGLLALHACLECGRCTSVCPASATGKLLSPMHLVMKLRDHAVQKSFAVTPRRAPWVTVTSARQAQPAGISAHVMSRAAPLWVPGIAGTATSTAPTQAAQHKAWQAVPGRSPLDVALFPEVITDEELWACTTCGSCSDHCPAGIEPEQMVAALRRGQVLMDGEVPDGPARTLRQLERYGNPWGLPSRQRGDWLAEYEAAAKQPLLTAEACFARGEPLPELFVWAGTMGAYDRRTRKVLFAFIRLLQHAGIRFAVLGAEERNSGDTARRMGDEALFQSQCIENIALLRRYGVKHLVTICPHTYHAMNREYRDFGLSSQVKVEHHSTLLARLVQEGRIRPVWQLEERVVYHDACYLGRIGGEYETPRALLQAIPGVALTEMRRNRGSSLCCGAGGGLMWNLPAAGKAVHEVRAAEALETRPTVIASACPYCLSMMEQAMAGQVTAHRVQAKDIAELLLAGVFGYSEV